MTGQAAEDRLYASSPPMATQAAYHPGSVLVIPPISLISQARPPVAII